MEDFMYPNLQENHLNLSVDYTIQLMKSIPNFPQLHIDFLPKIRRIAHLFPQSWFDDFVQEGTIALNNTRLKFKDYENPKRFIPMHYVQFVQG